MEPRRLLAGDLLPIQIGAVYYEDASGVDEAGDTFEITFDGGAPGTRLAQLSIETDKIGDGLTIGDVFFDVDPGGLGAFGAVELSILAQDGIDSVDVSVADGGTTMVFNFSGFEAGDRLIFTVDVDEQGFLGPNAVAEGNELEGSQLAATFTAPHYYDAVGDDIFIDYFDPKLDASGLDLPPDDYVPPGTVPKPIRTAAAIFPVEQTPLPITIAGTVFEDFDADNTQDPGDKGIEGVELALLRLTDTGYLATGQTAVTDTNGDYLFEGVLPGTYRVAETQPDGFLSVGSAAGTVDGVQRGVIDGPDAITEVKLGGGDQSVDNDFAEVRPASISGRVVVDMNANGKFDSGDLLLPDVTVNLVDGAGNLLATTKTGAEGRYAFTGLMPGVYGVEEIQPDGYLDAYDHVGSAGGTHSPPDSILDVSLGSGTVAVNYDFAEVLSASISGYVYVDQNNNGVKNFGEAPISGVELTLLDADGGPTGATTTTDASGYYVFENLLPGRAYGVAEVQPDGYLDGLDAAGTAGGAAHNPGDSITDALLPGGTRGKNYNFGELLPASIAGRVHADLIENCIVDPGEPLLEGVTVRLFDASGELVASTTTDAEGEYLFDNLRPDTYAVEEVQPSGYYDGPDTVGSAGGVLDGNDRIADVVLASGTAAVGYDFCELVPASISGYVFQDGPTIALKFGETTIDPATVRDGVLTLDDTPIEGVVLQLGDASGAPILDASGRPVTAVTGADGYYEFTNLRPGLYTVLESHPAGYIDSIDTAGSNGGIPVNPSQPVNPTILQQLAVDPVNDAILRISLGSGDTAVSYNFSEVLIVDAPPPLFILPPLPPEILIPPPVIQAPIFNSVVPAAYYVPAPIQKVLLPLYGGGGFASGAYTWHLSVVNGGRPRRNGDGDDEHLASVYNAYFNPASWTGADMDRSQWVLADGQGHPERQIQFGLTGGIPVTGDFNGDGITDVGVFFDGLWFLDLNGNGIWDKGDLWAKLGDAGDMPVTGDWDGDGKDDIGIYGRAWVGDRRAIGAESGLPDADNAPSGRFKNLPPTQNDATAGRRTMKRTALGNVRTDVIDHVFRFGTENDVAVAGDFNGDGVTNVGLFREGTWYLDTDGNGRWSAGDVFVEHFGTAGDVPVVGDFNGDGVDELGIYRRGRWMLDIDGDRALTAHDKVFELGGPHDKPVVGDFNGDGVDEIAIYRDGVVAPEAQVAHPAPAAPTDVASSP